jgi:hypothetical protein
MGEHLLLTDTSLYCAASMYTKAAIATIGSALPGMLTSERGVAQPDISRSSEGSLSFSWLG